MDTGRDERHTRRTLYLLLFAVPYSLLLVAACGWFLYRFRVLPMPKFDHTALPIARVLDGETVVSMPNGNLVGLVGQYPDELTAYLRFQYLAGVPAVRGAEVLMTSKEVEQKPVYNLYLVLPNDLLSSGRRLSKLRIERFIDRYSMDSPPVSELENWRKQTALFDAAYKQPVKQKLLELPASQLQSAVATFILFKNSTDKRAREQIVPTEKVLSEKESLQFAADMIDVAKFYDIPLSMLLGIGAMENNYMDVRGDLTHSVWKRHAEPGDIVLKRRKGRVLVSNYSQGPWQITRETLRYAHKLYLEDKRDYSKLPARLRPPRKLDLDKVDSHVLTTYAGLLLRNLLDYFHGDAAKAVGAYNGGRIKPNMQYAEGVNMVADYAHRVLSMAAGRKGNAVNETPLKVTEVAPPELPAS
ncbi:hypothetical protein [Edaphobacter sp. 12200R-103]|uniref:hypothetical protein n=1 Tax=Edaphobacter sp. 12200R-103 TaxID=2703788 RepID=UPI00138B27ED|nr:hypothetical protein [Edaphobacter sp. 12200R-103]QHS52842.1 hypothetical protein GWR55_14770 [Edaphobacter sp. 12200R-103]